MNVLDSKSETLQFFFTELKEMLDLICKALKNRTPHLNGEKYLTNKDVCAMLHVSARTLQQWRKKGKIPFIQIKGKILYRQSEVLSCLEMQTF